MNTDLSTGTQTKVNDYKTLIKSPSQQQKERLQEHKRVITLGIQIDDSGMKYIPHPLPLSGRAEGGKWDSADGTETL